MAINYLSEQGTIKYGIYEFVLDTENDITSIPDFSKAGSIALVIETGNVYMKNSKGEWKLL